MDISTCHHNAPDPSHHGATTQAASGPAHPRPADELHGRTLKALIAAQDAAEAAAAEAGYLLQLGQRLTGEPLYEATFTQAVRTWWELVGEQICQRQLHADHALRRVRSWARTYLTGEPPARGAGSLFDHALAHASRAAARRFLAASGELLVEHAVQLSSAAGGLEDAINGTGTGRAS
ncbi:hypothetical protein HII36_19180 [Nonomuraea sp. NN258]|uniref:hypothetical protein n=1 Tax=Nonomuraea antri TaxID=2730852 RepID=UPI001568F82B|nr:hypothetical protein [Nonomuraea antri]NRQ33957.1 hypothetical protein [Nonomuraea antri]